jgi:hypothetical protein
MEAGSIPVCHPNFIMSTLSLRCNKHPKYQAIRVPVAKCMACKELWLLKNGQGLLFGTTKDNPLPLTRRFEDGSQVLGEVTNE